MNFGYENRKIDITKVKDETVDLLIIGGGITGAGVAVQAAASGLRTVLIEMQDFAEGTSSRSTKLVHGGIRYLKTFDVDVVADTVSERANIQRIAPHIAKPAMMLLPIYDEPGATYTMFEASVAMDLYDHLANVTNPEYTNKKLTKEEVIAREPHILQDNLVGGGLYLDYRNDDARLVIENIKRAAADGAMMLSKTEAIKITHDDKGMVNGAQVRDVLTGETYEIKARLVINTGGPWVDAIRALDSKNEFAPEIRPTKGVHFVIDQDRLKVSQPTYFDTGKGDGRMIFVIPRSDKTYFGTTDTDYQGDYAHPQVTRDDVDYLLEIMNFRFPNVKLTLADIEASWAGLRPLIQSSAGSDYNGGAKMTITGASFDAIVAAVKDYLQDENKREAVETAVTEAVSVANSKAKNPSQVSRGSTLEVSQDGLITLAGGKITDYRLMAEGALILIRDLMQQQYDKKITLVDSTKYPISGGEIDPDNVEAALAELAKTAEAAGFSTEDAQYLANLYGSNLPVVLTYDTTFAGLDRKQSTSLHYALNEEMTLTPVDFLLRRTSNMLFMAETLDGLYVPVVDAMAKFYNWSAQERAAQLAALEAVITAIELHDLKG